MENSNLEILVSCVENNNSYYKTIRKSTVIIEISKFQWVPNFDIKVIINNGRTVDKWFHNLGAFDCYDMIRELNYIYK